MTVVRTRPTEIDLWAPVPFDGLPPALLEAAGRSDWQTVRDELRKVMDGLTTDGVSIIEVAALGERANVTVEVAMRHIDDAEAPREARLAAVEALGKLGTTHSREILHRVSRRTDGIGTAARRIVTSRTAGTTLSERELEVLDLARHGLTNRDIGERLSLSPHTIARHVANARAKLGAANRAEAAAKFEEMKV